MEQNMEQNTGPSIEPKIESKIKKQPNVLVIGAVIVLIVLGIWFWQVQKKAIAPETPEAIQQTAPISQEDSTPVIDQELNSIDLGDLNKEFQTIDTDLNSL